jgi:subfamily B ATP-binding cassette protein MsbA
MEASKATVDAALQARRVKSLLSPVVAIVVALCTGSCCGAGRR